MRGLYFLLFVGMTALLFSQVASAFVLTASAQSPQKLGLVRDHSMSVPIRIENLDADAHVVEIYSDSNSNYIEATPALEEIELSPQQAAEFSITFTVSPDAENGNYSVTVFVESDGQTITIPYTIYVGSNSFVTVVTFNEDVCANEYVGNLSFSVKNLSSTQVEMDFQAEQSILLPSVDPNSKRVNAGETEIMDLQVHTQPLNVGEYDGTILVKTPDIWAQKPFSVSVNSCPVQVEKPFEMTLPINPKSLVRFKTTNIPIVLKNLSDETQTITLSTDSIIPSTTQTIQLPKNEQATVQVPFSPDGSVSAGTYRVEFMASNGTYTQKKLLNLKVIPADHLELIANIPHFELEKGKSITVGFKLKNDGDSVQTVNFSMQNATPGVNYTFSPSTAVLGAQKELNVQLKIDALSTTSITQMTNQIIASGKSQAGYGISFDVISPEQLIEPVVIEFLSVPESISIKQGETREIEIVVFNNSDRVVSEINFRLAGAPNSGLELESPAFSVLAPYETRTISLTLRAARDAPIGVINPSIVIEAPRAEGVFGLRIDVQPRDAFSGLFTGLFSFTGNNVIGLIVLVFLVLLAMGVVYNRKTQNQSWQVSNKSQ